MALNTVTGAAQTVDTAGSAVSLQVLTISGPDTTQTPVTVRYLWPNDRTVDVYTTYTTNEALSISQPLAVTTTLSSGNESSQTESSAESTSTSTSSSITIETNAGTTASVSSPTPSSLSSPTPNIESESPPSDNGISSGALAGAIVGSIIGTALLALLLAFLFFRRRHAKPARGKELETETEAASGLPSKSAAPPFSLAAITPHPADDETIQRRILTLFDQAALHIDNYYSPGSSPAHLSREQRDSLAAYNSEALPASIESLIAQRGTRREVLTHALVRTLVRGIQPRGELLPGLFAARPVNGSDTALFAWRMLTAHLYASSKTTHPAAADGAADADAARTEGIYSLATDFTTAFTPYSFPSYTAEERGAHLVKLASATADLGVWLFGQPCEVAFVWGDYRKNESQAPCGFDVLPKVVKIGDERGRRLGEPVVLVERS